MKENKSDKRSDISTTKDRQESLSLMEPLLLREGSPKRRELTDLTLALAAKSAAFKASLPSALQSSLATLVRSMNCYYSNLIEGHNTHPIDIERALKGDYSKDTKKRNLQKEAEAHIAVQAWIDEGGLKGDFLSENAICEIHKRFYGLLPDELKWVEVPITKKKIKVIPGKLRHREVQVGNHIAISAGAVPRFLERYAKAYKSLGLTETLLALAPQHHRLLWIHPFLDGNGRVARLLSHATILDTLNTGGLWSISRGLARNVESYKSHLANCDLRRRNDLDGRGNLSEEALHDFIRFFLETCIDQIDFMEKLMEPKLLRTRILLWAREEIAVEKLPSQVLPVLEAILYRGEIGRGELSEILNITDRHARRVTAILIEQGILVSDTPKSSLKLAFPASLAHRFMPGLFPTL